MSGVAHGAYVRSWKAGALFFSSYHSEGFWPDRRAGLISVRAWRGLRYNEKYAVKLKLKNEKQRDKELAKAKAAEEEAKRKGAAKTNPFAVSYMKIYYGTDSLTPP